MRETISRLIEPIPAMDTLRKRKKLGYESILITRSTAHYSEPLVEARDFGIAGQNYYSRPNATVAEALPGVPRFPMIRESVGETLSRINELLCSKAIALFFGGEVELYIEDGLRSTELQRRLFDIEVPQLLRRNEPSLSDDEIDRRKRDIIAAPSTDPNSPSPHSTGGAVDVVLRYRQESPLYVPDTNVWLGHRDGDTSLTIEPDYYENHPLETSEDELAQRNRRAFFAIMTGRAFATQTGLAVNPTEIWHWSKGDQLWALVTDAPNAYYGPVNK